MFFDGNEPEKVLDNSDLSATLTLQPKFAPTVVVTFDNGVLSNVR